MNELDGFKKLRSGANKSVKIKVKGQAMNELDGYGLKKGHVIAFFVWICVTIVMMLILHLIGKLNHFTGPMVALGLVWCYAFLSYHLYGD